MRVGEAKIERDRRRARHASRPIAAAPGTFGVVAGPDSDRLKADFLASSLGWASPSMDTIAQVREGLPFETLDGLNTILPGVTYRIVPKSTLATLKKRSDRLPPEQSDRLYQTGKVVGFAMSIYRDEDKVRAFLTRPHPMLEDRPPLDVTLESGAGADIVINLLGGGAYGGGA